VKRTHRLAVVCWLAMVMSLVLFAFVAEMIAAPNAPFRGFVDFHQIDLLGYVFVGLTIVDFALLRVVGSRILARGVGLSVTPHRDASLAERRLFVKTMVDFAVCTGIGATEDSTSSRTSGCATPSLRRERDDVEDARLGTANDRSGQKI